MENQAPDGCSRPATGVRRQDEARARPSDFTRPAGRGVDRNAQPNSSVHLREGDGDTLPRYPHGPKPEVLMHAESTIRTGKLLVNLDTRVVTADGRPVPIGGKEYAILELLSLRKGTIVTKEMFLNHLYGGMGEPELKIIDVFVSKLRKNIAQATGGEHYIETVWGRGYVLRDPTPPDLPDLTRMPLQRLVVNPNRRLTKWLGERRHRG